MQTRVRQIVKRTLLTAAASLLLLASYLGGSLGHSWHFGRGWINGVTYQHVVGSVFAPIQWWSRSDLPGSVSMYHCYCLALHAGRDAQLKAIEHRRKPGR